MIINGLQVRCEFDDEPEPGSYFLVKCIGGGQAWYELHDRAPRTNQSREVLLDGWLGETNNVSRTSRGAVEISRVDGMPTAMRIDADKLLASLSVEEEI